MLSDDPDPSAGCPPWPSGQSGRGSKMPYTNGIDESAQLIAPVRYFRGFGTWLILQALEILVYQFLLEYFNGVIALHRSS